MKKFFVLLILCIGTNAIACTDFTGTWAGHCEGEAPEDFTLAIYQDSCQLVSEQFTKIPAGFSGTRYFASPQSFVGATMIERMEYKNKEGKDAVMIETRKARWNEDQTVLLSTDEFRNDAEEFLMTNETTMSIVNGQLVQEGRGVPKNDHGYRCVYNRVK